MFLIIKDENTGKFWGNGNWVSEYPEAIIFDIKSRAVAKCTSLRIDGGYSYATVWNNYGMENEAIIF